MIDWVRVDELRHDIGDDGFAEVVELFLDEVEEVVMRLQARPDPARLEEDLHFLKGCAWNLGFAEFGALCHDGERMAAAGQAAQVQLPPVLACYGQSKAAFLQGLAGPGQSGRPCAA